MRKFNVTGVCVPTKDYMVDISGKLEQIMKLIADGCYFTINRARQYGKTTTLSMIQATLPSEYICMRISFQGVDEESFETGEAFCKMFLNLTYDALKSGSIDKEYKDKWLDPTVIDFLLLSRHISKMCENRKVVLIVDEVDQTSHNRVFIRFLGMLREKFLKRREDRDNTFHSVIFAGVYDIKDIKIKLIDEGKYTLAEGETKIYNSPWNIAVNFNVAMSFSPSEIVTMLVEYEKDHNTGMNIAKIAEAIYDYTSGYPFMVSRVCQCIDEELGKDWTVGGIQKAVQHMLDEKSTLFNDVIKNLENNKDLHDYIYDMLILGDYKAYSIYNPIVSTGDRYGFLKKAANGSAKVVISNKIFELLMTDYFLSYGESVHRPSPYGYSDRLRPSAIYS